MEHRSNDKINALLSKRDPRPDLRPPMNKPMAIQLMRNFDPLEHIGCKTANTACAVQHGSALQKAGLDHSMIKSQTAGSFVRLQQKYGNRFVQRVVAQHRQIMPKRAYSAGAIRQEPIPELKVQRQDEEKEESNGMAPGTASGRVKGGMGALDYLVSTATSPLPQIQRGSTPPVNVCNTSLPTGETTHSNGWGSGNSATIHKWRQQLTPTTTNFQGCQVTEADPGGGSDSCWFSGSAYSPFNAVTGGTWTVGASNRWGDDWVGWYAPAVTYYRAQGKAPCTATFPQSMRIVRPSGNVQYVRHQLTATIGATTVSSTRAGQTRSKTWP